MGSLEDEVGSSFLGNLETNADQIYIEKTDGSNLTEDEYVGTEMKLILIKGKEKIELTLIVLGDVTGEGVFRGNDLTIARDYINTDGLSDAAIEIFGKSEAKRLALDVTVDGKINGPDLNVMNQANNDDRNAFMEYISNNCYYNINIISGNSISQTWKNYRNNK